MIELSLDTLHELSTDLQTKDDDELNAKYNFNIQEVENVVSDYVDQSYVENDVYHIFPIVTMAMLILNAIFIMYLKP
jgi:hypothetical protein